VETEIFLLVSKKKIKYYNICWRQCGIIISSEDATDSGQVALRATEPAQTLDPHPDAMALTINSR
jgi:hypothetical protein